MTRLDEHLPAELQDVASVLSTRRHQPTALELDRIKTDARRRAARRARADLNRKGLLVRSRLFITALVAGGILMLGGGAALGITGLSSTRSASIAQYGTSTTATGLLPNVVTTTTTTTTTPPVVTTEEEPTEELGEDDGAAPEREVQGAKQVAADELPFTGYLAIPILVLGLVMLAAGLALRRSRNALDADV